MENIVAARISANDRAEMRMSIVADTHDNLTQQYRVVRVDRNPQTPLCILRNKLQHIDAKIIAERWWRQSI